MATKTPAATAAAATALLVRSSSGSFGVLNGHDGRRDNGARGGGPSKVKPATYQVPVVPGTPVPWLLRCALYISYVSTAAVRVGFRRSNGSACLLLTLMCAALDAVGGAEVSGVFCFAGVTVEE